MVNLSRPSLALFVGIAVFALILASSLVAFGVITDADPADEGYPPYANFSFEVENQTDEQETGLAVTIEFQSGADLPQEEVRLLVNGAPAGELQASEPDEPDASPAWNDSEDTIADSPARIDGYVEADRDEPIEGGDVVEVVWTAPDGEQMTVLRRYVVEA